MSDRGEHGQRLHHIHALRLDYDVHPLLAEDLPEAPSQAFADWFAHAEQAQVVEPNAMVLATMGEDGVPSARTVLLKGVTGAGFRFFTNYQSRKGREIAAHPWATLLFAWVAMHRQVCITGEVVRLPPQESDAYFATRPRDSQIAAWASPQSQRIADRAEVLDEWRRLAARFADGPVRRPPHWGGFELRPRRIEFWQGQPSRMHDRIVYLARSTGPSPLDDAACWERVRLAP